jgi:cytidylate kinase
MFETPSRLVSKAARWMRVQRRAFDYFSLPAFKPNATFTPCITIARDPGSGGRVIAQQVATKLGLKFYDENLIDDVARTIKKDANVIAKIDEKARGAIEDLVHSLINPEYVSDVEYLKHLSRAMLTVVHQQGSVLLGRGSNVIIGPEHGLHVLITAPYDVRVARAVEYEKVSKRKAQGIIAKVTKERKDFVEEYFQKDYNDPTSYDLTLNTASLDIEQAAEIIIAAYKKKFRR